VHEEVVDFGHKLLNALLIVVPNPREKVIDGFFQGMFEVRLKASLLRANCPQGTQLGIKTNETVGSHRKVPVIVLKGSFGDGLRRSLDEW
jgi:hypothetical protein